MWFLHSPVPPRLRPIAFLALGLLLASAVLPIWRVVQDGGSRDAWGLWGIRGCGGPDNCGFDKLPSAAEIGPSVLIVAATTMLGLAMLLIARRARNWMRGWTMVSSVLAIVGGAMFLLDLPPREDATLGPGSMFLFAGALIAFAIAAVTTIEPRDVPEV